jgi:GTPase SAR1 family protein
VTSVEEEEVGPTIGVGFFTQRISVPERVKVNYHLWDTSGTERFRSIITPYLRSVGIVFIVFDVGDRTTWNHVDYWRDLAIKYCDSHILPLFALIGCQADKENHAVGGLEMAEKADQWKCPWWKISTTTQLQLGNFFASSGTLGGVLARRAEYVNEVNTPPKVLTKKVRGNHADICGQQPASWKE